jgi:integrase
VQSPCPTITAADVAELIGKLAETRKRETVRKTLLALGMVLDHAGVSPNPERDKVAVRLPREERTEIVPPTAEHVLAVHALLPTRYRLPLVVLDATAMRLGELEGLRWGDVDDPRGRWRVRIRVEDELRPLDERAATRVRRRARPLAATSR